MITWSGNTVILRRKLPHWNIRLRNMWKITLHTVHRFDAASFSGLFTLFLSWIFSFICTRAVSTGLRTDTALKLIQVCTKNSNLLRLLSYWTASIKYFQNYVEFNRDRYGIEYVRWRMYHLCTGNTLLAITPSGIYSCALKRKPAPSLPSLVWDEEGFELQSHDELFENATNKENSQLQQVICLETSSRIFHLAPCISNITHWFIHQNSLHRNQKFRPFESLN
jgi:hypothetical protein